MPLSSRSFEARIRRRGARIYAGCCRCALFGAKFSEDKICGEPPGGLNLNLKASNSYAVRFASCLSRGGIKRAYPLRLSPVYVQAVVGANFINSPFYYLPISYISQDFCQISLNSGDSFIREAFFCFYRDHKLFYNTRWPSFCRLRYSN